MSDWFLVSAWFEKADTEVHFEITNEDGEQYFFYLASNVITTQLVHFQGNALDAFYYAEEDMQAMAVSIIDSEMLEPQSHFKITDRLANSHYL